LPVPFFGAKRKVKIYFCLARGVGREFIPFHWRDLGENSLPCTPGILFCFDIL
jgi:hypothetical protein